MSIERDPMEPLAGRALENRRQWEIDRARGKKSSNEHEKPVNYGPIVFPDAAGLRHAALVVCAAHADRPNGVTEAREVCWALGIPQIMRDGGDGRAMRRELRRVLDPEDLPPLGFGENDVGRPEPKKGRR